MEHPDEEVFKLWPTTLNRNIFKQIIDAGSGSAVEKRFPPVRLPRKRDTTMADRRGSNWQSNQPSGVLHYSDCHVAANSRTPGTRAARQEERIFGPPSRAANRARPTRTVVSIMATAGQNYSIRRDGLSAPCQGRPCRIGRTHSIPKLARPDPREFDAPEQTPKTGGEQRCIRNQAR